jgi:hypothetical protein
MCRVNSYKANYRHSTVLLQIMGYKEVLEENHNKAEKQTSKQMAREVTKYDINSIIIIIMENRSIITVLIVTIQLFNSLLFMCPVSSYKASYRQNTVKIYVTT